MSKTLKILLTILAILLFFSFLSLYLTFSLQSPAGSETKAMIFEIKPATSSTQIAEELETKGLIKSKWLFLIYLKLKRGIIKAGTYEFSPSENLVQIVDKITKGDVKEWVVTFPEGFSLKDMGERLQEKGVLKKEDFLKEASLVYKYQKDFAFLEVKASNLEGYLFPDTYHFGLNVNAEELINKMLKNFEKKVNPKDISALSSVIILASIVEREANKPEDRAKIASVYLNRLAKNMKLEADPTVQYAKGSWEPITQQDYQKINSPYNTYKYSGLTPGPISNPGLASIQAVLNPEKTDYFYFFHTKDGQTIFSKTKEEHEAKRKNM